MADQLIVEDPVLIQVIRTAIQDYRTGALGRAKALRKLDGLAARICLWLERNGHGTIAEISTELHADVSSVTRAAKELLQAGQVAIVQERHQDGAGVRRTRLRVLQPKRVQVDLSDPNELPRRQPGTVSH